MTMGIHYSAELARFASQLQFEDIPEDVISRAEDLLVVCCP